MVNVLTICGSLGAESANRSALTVIERWLAAGAVVVTRDESLGAIPPFRPEQVDAPAAAVAEFRSQIAAADAVVIAGPEYAGSLAGTIKNALDWVVGSGELYEKPVGILSAGTTGGPFARQVLAQTLLWQGAHVVAQLGIAAPKTKTDTAGVYTDSATVTALNAFAAAVIESLTMPAETRANVSRGVAASVGASRDATTPAEIRLEAADGEAPRCYVCDRPMELGGVYATDGIMRWLREGQNAPILLSFRAERIGGGVMTDGPIRASRCRPCGRIVMFTPPAMKIPI
ncbi:MAG: NAD(P)H-dependent oxidoreductase [Ilumatobacteraceae bacterium]